MYLVLLGVVIIGIILVTITIACLFYRLPENPEDQFIELPANPEDKSVALVFGGSANQGLSKVKEYLDKDYIVIVASRKYLGWNQAFREIKYKRKVGRSKHNVADLSLTDQAGEVMLDVSTMSEDTQLNKSPNLGWTRCDARIDTQVSDVFKTVYAQYGKLDLLIHACLTEGSDSILTCPYRADYRDGRYNLGYSGKNLERYGGSKDTEYSLYANMVKTSNIIREANYWQVPLVLLPRGKSPIIRGLIDSVIEDHRYDIWQ